MDTREKKREFDPCINGRSCGAGVNHISSLASDFEIDLMSLS
jgi:hypothetical protein